MRWPPISHGTASSASTGALRIRSTPFGLARVARQAAGVDDGREHEPHRLELALQAGIPAQARDEAREVRDHDLGINALQPVHAAEEAERGNRGVGVAEREGEHRQHLLAMGHLAHHALLDQRAGGVGHALQLGQFGRPGEGRSRRHEVQR